MLQDKTFLFLEITKVHSEEFFHSLDYIPLDNF